MLLAFLIKFVPIKYCVQKFYLRLFCVCYFYSVEIRFLRQSFRRTFLFRNIWLLLLYDLVSLLWSLFSSIFEVKFLSPWPTIPLFCSSFSTLIVPSQGEFLSSSSSCWLDFSQDNQTPNHFCLLNQFRGIEDSPLLQMQ